jgi:hypothetical protein
VKGNTGIGNEVKRNIRFLQIQQCALERFTGYLQMHSIEDIAQMHTLDSSNSPVSLRALHWLSPNAFNRRYSSNAYIRFLRIHQCALESFTGYLQMHSIEGIAQMHTLDFFEFTTVP